MKNLSKCLYFGAGLLATISLLGIVILFILNHTASSINYKYAIAIDSGSTHSRVILFRWKAAKLNNTGIVEEVKSCKVKIGISSFVGKKINDVAIKLLHCIRDVSQYANEDEDLFVYLGATAGMRVLNRTEPETVSKIFSKIKEGFDSVGLNSSLSIISGKEEGLFAWIAANYLSGTLFQQPKPNQIYGILDMGGASAQIAYPTNNTSNDDEDLIHVNLFGRDFHVNTFSNLCFGVEQAFNRYLKLLIIRHRAKSDSSLIRVPCLPINFKTNTSQYQVYNNICTKSKNSIFNENQKYYKLIGTSQPDQCQQAIDELLNKDSCQKDFEICFKEMAEHKRNPFYAISAYYHVTKVLKPNQTENISRQQYLDKSKDICSTNEKELIDNYGIPRKYTSSVCFKLSYVISTLTKLYKFDEESWPKLKFVNHVNNSYLGWITGFMLNETNRVPSEFSNKFPIDNEIYFPLITLLILLFFLSIFTICHRMNINSKSMLKNPTNGSQNC